MGCFLACFGSSKNKRCAKPTLVSSSSSAPSPKFESSCKPLQQNLAPKQAKLDESIIVVPHSPAKQEEQLSAGVPKKVTFVSNVRIHNPVPDSVEKAAEISPGTKRSGDEKVVVNGVSMAEQNVLPPASKNGGSALSSLGGYDSYPPNHRYHNCRESDNEDELECEEEIDVDDYDEDKDAAETESADDDVYDAYDMEEYSPNTNQERTPGSFSSMESRTKSSTSCLPMRNLDGMLDDTTLVAETKTREFNANDGYAQNLTQLNAVKPKVELPLVEQKENSSTAEERQLVKFQLNLDGAKDEREQAVDASLSSWLVSSQKTPAQKATARGLEAIPSETTQTSASSHGSNSVRSFFSDRPILGALTMEQLKQIEASESPRKSPSHSAADRPIIGSVGSHWSEETPSVESGPASTFKGIPNTTSKYREDKTVKWHSTPFETRLEQALKKGASGVPF